MAVVSWCWPKITRVGQITQAIRDGFEFVQLPVPENARPSATVSYGLRRDGKQAAPDVLPSGLARIAVTRGLVAVVGKLPDGAILFQLTSRAGGTAEA